MPYLSLYRKYRSRTFDEIFGQDAIVRTLKNAVDSGKVAHAYLFSGPRGTGKTSTARILAKSLNCVEGPTSNPCNKCDSCLAINHDSHLDVIEIDAASNRKIDDVRELRDNVGYAPSQGKFKVYIIDEVHMLTTEASNALLKTLEEPPAHVIFVLATTEAHQLLPTILSRCQWYEFKRIPPKAMLLRLRQIIEAEGIEVQESTLNQIVKKASGSLRDALGLLDRLVTFGGDNIDPTQALELLGIPSDERVIGFLEAVRDGDLGSNLDRIGNLAFEGMDYRQFLRSLSEWLMEILYCQNSPDHSGSIIEPDVRKRIQGLAGDLNGDWVLKAIGVLNQADDSLRVDTQSRLALEVAAVRLHDLLQNPAPPPVSAPIRVSAPGPGISAPEPKPPKKRKPDPEPQSAPVTSAPAPEEKVESSAQKPDAVVTEAPPVPPKASTLEPELQDFAAQWNVFLKALRNKKVTVHAIFSDARPVGFDGNKVTIAFPHEFHKDRAAEAKNLDVVMDVLESVFGKRYEVECVLEKTEETEQKKPAKKPGAASPKPDSREGGSDLRQLQQIFPGSRVVE